MLYLHIGPDTLTRDELDKLSRSGLDYWHMRTEYAASWVHKLSTPPSSSGMDAAEALYQRHHGYPRHLHNAGIHIDVRANVHLTLKGGEGWRVDAYGQTLSTALRNLAREVAQREKSEPSRLRKLRTAKVAEVERQIGPKRRRKARG
jgi:hypothetical protein